MKKIFTLVIITLSFAASAQTLVYNQTGEEFSGPFPSWKNVKTDFAAMGDGITNDAPAINAALLAMRLTQTNNYNVLYFPAGTYLIDTTLFNPNRLAGDDYSGMALIGEDPATTIIKWNGAAFGDMMQLNGWYMRTSRITFDGNNSAGRGIFHTGGFGTGCEFSDLVFQNFNPAGNVGLDFSAPTNGQAENAVIRCKFINCKYGIVSCNWNSLDQWIWYCLFQNCVYGIDLCIGYFQIYGNVFINCTGYDIGGGNTYQSAVVNNTSVGSHCFYQKGPGLLRGNKIYTDVDTFSTVGAILMDNIFRNGNSIKPVQRIAGINITGDKNLFVGNTYTNAHRNYPFSWAVQPPFQNFDHGVGGNYIVNHEIEKAIDNDSATYFTAGLWAPQAGLRWNCLPQNPKVVTSYTIRQGGNLTEAPKDFQLRASNDYGYTWTVLDSETNQTWTLGQKKTFSISNAQAYSLYEFNILTNASGLTPGAGGWVSVAETEFKEASGNDITSDATGLLTGADELWGAYYPIDNITTDTAAVNIPATISLPATPQNFYRTIFEVQQGTGNDAAAIQQKIDSAAMLSSGNKPVVHIPKGTYNVNTTLVVPALSDMQLTGDGVGSGTISTINWTGNNTGPLIKFMGPARATVKDIQFQIPYHLNAGMEAIRVEDADQAGGRIYADQFFAGSADAAHQCDVAVYADGIENSDITFICTSFGAAANGVVKAKGGPVLSSGGNTNGQISLLSGACGGTQNLFAVENGGRIDAEGMWYEGNAPTNTSGLIDLSNTSGKLSVACMQWHLNNSPYPVIKTHNFSGTLMLLDNYIDQVPRTEIQMSGDGTNTAIFSAYNDFAGNDTIGITTDSIWEDTTFPDGNIALMSSYAGMGAYSGPLDDVKNKIHNMPPDTTFVLNAISQLRAVRTDPPMDMAAGVTDVKFFRCASRTVEGNIPVHFVASIPSGISVSGFENSISLYPNPSSESIIIKTGKYFQNMNVEIFNGTGEKIYSATMNGNYLTIKCKSYASGIYLLKISSGEKMMTKKMVISH